MSFTEVPFIALLAVVYALWLLLRSQYQAKVWLLTFASLVFYGYDQWELLALILAYCLVDWGVGQWIARSRRPGLVLALGVCFNLLVLGYWKYTPLVVRTIARVALALDLPLPAAPPTDWFIPFGISFYAFTGIAYMVDVYRRQTPAEPSFWRFTLFLTFFPQLVAGPILRAREFLPNLQPAAMPDKPQAALEALQLLARGYFKKLVLADRIALAVDPFFVHVGDASTAGVWALPYVYLYALQIYFDFSAYTDIARGLGLLFGFRWPDNFHLPYLAASVQEFWRRWHVTLSQFLRDYLYLPLGGSRLGRWRTIGNLMATMLLGGLWHGASWSFMVWGGLHGAYLIVHRAWCAGPFCRRLAALEGPAGGLWRLAAVALTFHCVCLAWCFFRLTDLAQSLACVQQWFVFDADKLAAGGAADRSLWLVLAAYGAVTGMAHLGAARPAAGGRQERRVLAPLSLGFRWGTVAMLLMLALLLSPGGDAPAFIYFQF